MNDDATFQFGSNAKVIADSVSPAGDRVTTIEATMHRFVLAELNTHRVFSRNSASSRAIPFAKQVERIKNHPAVPVSFPAEQRGMSGGEELQAGRRDYAETVWLEAAETAVTKAQELAAIGVHKSVVNRILEPFMWHTVIITSVDYSNYFGLRCNPMAQPEIRVVSEMMQDAYNASKPTELDEGDWHTPYVTDDDYPAAESIVYNDEAAYDGRGFDVRVAALLRQVSAARCARVSYLTHDGVRDLEKDVELYERLTSARPPHSSPLEHVATPFVRRRDGVKRQGNFPGWTQLRHIVEREIYG